MAGVGNGQYPVFPQKLGAKNCRTEVRGIYQHLSSRQFSREPKLGFAFKCQVASASNRRVDRKYPLQG